MGHYYSSSHYYTSNHMEAIYSTLFDTATSHSKYHNKGTIKATGQQTCSQLQLNQASPPSSGSPNSHQHQQQFNHSQTVSELISLHKNSVSWPYNTTQDHQVTQQHENQGESSNLSRGGLTWCFYRYLGQRFFSHVLPLKGKTDVNSRERREERLLQLCYRWQTYLNRTMKFISENSYMYDPTEKLLLSGKPPLCSHYAQWKEDS